MSALHEACQKTGIAYREVPADGKWHLTDATDGRQKNGNGRIKLFPDGNGGMVQNWTTMETPEVFFHDSGKTLTPAELAERKKLAEVRQREVALEEEKANAKAAALATSVYKKSADVQDNPYLSRKGVSPVESMKQIWIDDLVKLIGYKPQAKGRDLSGMILVVPIGDNNGISSIEMIDGSGLKAALKGGKKGGKYWLTKKLPAGNGDGLVVLIGEGVATVLSAVAAVPDSHGVAAFSCHNLKAVAQKMRDRFPAAKIIVLSDLGHGQPAAEDVAREAGCLLAVPVMPEGSTGTDLNDLHQVSGLDEVARQLALAVEPQQNKQEAAGTVSANVPLPDSILESERATDAAGANTVNGLPFDLNRLKSGADISAGDYVVSYVVDKLIPENCIVLWYAKGGSGKSTLATQIAAAVEHGKPFMGLETLQRPAVVIDYENPLAVLKTRIDAIDGASSIRFWTGDAGPPQFNKPAWAEIKDLVLTLHNPVVILDTLSSSCSDLDIASNKDYAPVMSRIIEIRNMGATIILLHHTPKGDETKYIGASCIYNQSDHILAMYPVRKPGVEQETADDDEASIYRLGTKDKTRFNHFHLYVEFDDGTGTFVQSSDPDSELIDRIRQIITDLPGITQSGILEKVAPTGKVKKLLSNHEGQIWRCEQGAKNAKRYHIISARQFDAPLRADKLANRIQLDKGSCQAAVINTQQTSIKPMFDSYSEGACQARQTEISSYTPALPPDDLADFNLDDDLPDFDLDDAEVFA